MTYATPLDLLTRFGADEIAQRCDRGIPRLVTPDLLRTVIADGDVFGIAQEAVDRARLAAAALERAIADAGSTIDSYVSGRYRLPLSTVPSVLQRIAGDLARYYLYDDQVTEQIKQRHDAAVKLLGDVSRGVVQLGADAVSGDQPVSTASAELVTGGRVWGRGTSSGFL